MQTESLYPYIVPKAYLQYQRPEDFARSLGHDVYVVLMKELRGVAGNVTANELSSLKLSADEAYAIALGNLEKLFKGGIIKAQKFPDGPSGKPFIVIAGHWDAAAVPLLDRFADFAKKNIGQEEVWLSIPRQGISLVFPAGDTTHDSAVRGFIREHEGNEGKPITFELFRFQGPSLIPCQVRDSGHQLGSE